MLAPVTQAYLLAALEGTPDVLANLLSGLSPDSPRWDIRPAPERFSLREILAHLADAEPMWQERAIRTRDEEMPHFPSRPREADYSQIVPSEALARFRADRLAYLETLRSLPDAAWGRQAQSQFLGTVTLEDQAVFVLAHDGYHTQQIAQWVAQTQSV